MKTLAILVFELSAVNLIDHSQITQKVNRQVQEEPQAEVAANPWHQEEEKKWYRLTDA